MLLNVVVMCHIWEAVREKFVNQEEKAMNLDNPKFDLDALVHMKS